MSQKLDPHPSNQLGGGGLSDETELLAAGYTYARRVSYAVGNKTMGMLLCARRPLADCVRDMLVSAEKTKRAARAKPAVRVATPE